MRGDKRYRWCAVDSRGRYFWEGVRTLTPEQAEEQAAAALNHPTLWGEHRPVAPFRVMRLDQRQREVDMDWSYNSRPGEVLLWVIQTKEERDPETHEPFYWSGTFGWVGREDADAFLPEEKDAFRLPKGGEWRNGTYVTVAEAEELRRANDKSMEA